MRQKTYQRPVKMTIQLKLSLLAIGATHIEGVLNFFTFLSCILHQCREAHIFTRIDNNFEHAPQRTKARAAPPVGVRESAFLKEDEGRSRRFSPCPQELWRAPQTSTAAQEQQISWLSRSGCPTAGLTEIQTTRSSKGQNSPPNRSRRQIEILPCHPLPNNPILDDHSVAWRIFDSELSLRAQSAVFHLPLVEYLKPLVEYLKCRIEKGPTLPIREGALRLSQHSAERVFIRYEAFKLSRQLRSQDHRIPARRCDLLLR